MIQELAGSVRAQAGLANILAADVTELEEYDKCLCWPNIVIRSGKVTHPVVLLVELSHFSNCAPTSGQHETITGPKGEFEFEVYVHDTDMFRIEG